MYRTPSSIIHSVHRLARRPSGISGGDNNYAPSDMMKHVLSQKKKGKLTIHNAKIKKSGTTMGSLKTGEKVAIGGGGVTVDYDAQGWKTKIRKKGKKAVKRLQESAKGVTGISDARGLSDKKGFVDYDPGPEKRLNQTDTKPEYWDEPFDVDPPKTPMKKTEEGPNPWTNWQVAGVAAMAQGMSGITITGKQGGS